MAWVLVAVLLGGMTGVAVAMTILVARLRIRDKRGAEAVRRERREVMVARMKKDVDS